MSPAAELRSERTLAAMALRESGTSPRKRDDTNFGRLPPQEIGGNKRKAQLAAAAAVQGL